MTDLSIPTDPESEHRAVLAAADFLLWLADAGRMVRAPGLGNGRIVADWLSADAMLCGVSIEWSDRRGTVGYSVAQAREIGLEPDWSARLRELGPAMGGMQLCR